MKYLVAYKPCGCVGSWIRDPNHPGRLEDFRAIYERRGAIVRESESLPPSGEDCPHGSLPAQLAAKLREAEAREAGLRKWLRERIEEEDNASELYRGGVRDPAWVQCQAHSEAFTEVLVKLDGNGQREGSKP